MKKSMTEVSAVYKNTQQALELLIKNSAIAQDMYRNNPRLSSFTSEECKKGYLKEYCTVRCCTARRSGHSTALVNVVLDTFHNVLFLSPNIAMTERLRDLACATLKEKVLGTSKSTVGEIWGQDDSRYFFKPFTCLKPQSVDALRGYSFEAICVDCANFLKPKQADVIYKEFAPHVFTSKYKFFIFME
jgi:hypothetical protein